MNRFSRFTKARRKYGIVEGLRLAIKPELPSDVEKDLERVIDLLVRVGKPIKEIKLYGSLDQGRWKRRFSDIDLAIFMATDIEAYSRFTRVMGREEIQRLIFQREKMMPESDFLDMLREGEDLVFRERYDLFVVTPKDSGIMMGGCLNLPDMDYRQYYLLTRGRDPVEFIWAAKRGRLLYSKDL